MDKVIGLAVGADDYVSNPLSPRELAARGKAMLRRPRSGGAERDELRPTRSVCKGRPLPCQSTHVEQHQSCDFARDMRVVGDVDADQDKAARVRHVVEEAD